MSRARWLTLLIGDAGAERVVPRTGLGVWLIVVGTAAMAALAVLALAFSLAADRLADRWTQELAQSASVTLSGSEASQDAERLIAILQTTPGIETAQLLSRQEAQQLVAPWFGSETVLDTLPLPQVVLVRETPAGPDREGLRLRLAAELPMAIYDDHARWRRPVQAAGTRLVLIGWAAFGIIIVAMGVIVALATRAALAANRRVIATLRLVGARDAFIVRAFVRRFVLRAGIGSGLGAAVMSGLLLMIPATATEGPFETGLGVSGLAWALVPIIPCLAILVAFMVSRRSAYNMLQSLQDS